MFGWKDRTDEQGSLKRYLLGTPFAKQLQTFPYMSVEILPVAFRANFPRVLSEADLKPSV